MKQQQTIVAEEAVEILGNKLPVSVFDSAGFWAFAILMSAIAIFYIARKYDNK